MKLCLILFVAICLVSVSFGEILPNLKGVWSEEVCNVQIGSNQLYQNRTLTFGPYNYGAKEGLFQLTEFVYRANPCVYGQQSWRLISTGTYSFAGQSSVLQGFYNINYFVKQKYLEPFTTSDANYLQSLDGCNWLGPWEADLRQDVTLVDCEPLKLISVFECPIVFDLIRVEGPRLYVGYPYTSNPQRYLAPCLSYQRPTTYDPYSLLFNQDLTNVVFTGPGAPGIASFNILPFITPTQAAVSIIPQLFVIVLAALFVFFF